MEEYKTKNKISKTKYQRTNKAGVESRDTKTGIDCNACLFVDVLYFTSHFLRGCFLKTSLLYTSDAADE